MALSKVNPNLITNGGSRKNIVINGAMQLAQRNTSTTSHSGYGSDRFEANAANLDQLAVTLTQNSVTDLPQFTKSLKFTTTTAENAIESNEYFRIMQKIESQSCQQLAYGTSSAKSVTLSFWIKSSVTGTYALSLFADASAGTRIIGSTYTISSANTWEKKTLTFAGDTARVMDNNNSEGLRLMWFIGADSALTSSNNTSWGAYSASKLAYGQGTNAVLTTSGATWEVTGVQLEVGSVATDFEHRSYGEELALCQRYCHVFQNGSTEAHLGVGAQYNVTAVNIALHLPNSLRVSPTVERILDGSSNWLQVYVGGASQSSNSVPQINDFSGNTIRLYCPSSITNRTAGEASWCHVKPNAKLILSAEL